MRRTAICLLLWTGALQASSTTTWEMSGYGDFIKGRFSGLSLTRDGRLQTSPKVEPVFGFNEPAVWSIVEDSSGNLYAAAGHRGRVYKIDKSGKGSVYWTAGEPQVFALALGKDGALYAGTSPDGKIYRITNGGAATEYFAPGARYVWSLVFDNAGVLYAATGDQGKIFRIPSVGKGEVYYETGQSNITSLALDREGRLLAGSDPNGLLYRISGKDSAFVLYDSNLPEIRGIATAPDGALYVSALGGSIASRTTPVTTLPGTLSSTTVVSSTGTSITVTDNAAPNPAINVDPKAEAPKTATPAPAPAVVSTVSPTIDLIGSEKSAIYRIAPDNTVETLWTSKEENAYDLLVADGQVLFGTDVEGRIYRLNPDRHLTLIAQTGDGEITRLLLSNGTLLAATSSMAKLFRLGSGSAGSGAYESPVHDAGSVARWGRASWNGSGNVALRTRSGNSARPDKTWSNWSEPMTAASGSTIRSPNARFVQWKAELSEAGSSGSGLQGVSIAYLPQNASPVVRSITVTTTGAAAPAGSRPQPAGAAASTTGVYSITVTDTGDVSVPASAGTPTQNVLRPMSQQITVSWAAEDTDNDRLVYGLYFRGEGEEQWKLLRGNLTDPALTLEGEVFADGKYLFRVLASDKLSNPPDAARESDLVSAPVLFDNTPPDVRIVSAKRQAGAVEIEIEAEDRVSPLRRAEYSLDATAWVPISSEDGIIDGLKERLKATLPSVSPGEHLIVIRVYDSSNNAGLARTVVR